MTEEERMQMSALGRQEVRSAIQAITPRHTAMLNHSRPYVMNEAAAQAWITERQEDEHSRILRVALLDLQTKGYLTPIDDVWPEPNP